MRGKKNPTDFSNATVDDLQGDVERTDEANKAEQRAIKLADIHVERVQDDQNRLRWFYRISLGILIVTVLVTFAVIWHLACKEELNGNVAIAFFASVTAQVIGLAHIISRYFFPEGGGLTEMPSNNG